MRTRSTALLAARLGLSTLFVFAGLMFAFSSAAGAAVTTPLVSTSTSDSGGSVVGNNTVLSVTFSAAPVLASTYSLTLTDGSHVATLSTAAGTLSASVNGTSIAFTVHGATSLMLSVLEILAATGVSDSSGNPWNLVASGQIDKPTSCTNIAGFTRVFRGSNCNIAGPIPPDVFDVIPLPTVDLPGPPNDNAPEVITGCQAGSTDVAYDLNTGAQLGSNPCGNNPNECSIGNTCGNTLDYMSTPNLASFEEVGIVETIPSSTYVSATAVPPQLSAITVNGSQATFTYYGKVVCQGTSTDPNTISQFSWESPYTNLQASGKMYASGIACPPSAGATSITVSWPSTIPFSSSVRFKYEAYGPGHFIVGAPSSTFAGQREASESAYAGPTAAITSFTPPTTTMPTSSGGSVNASFATTNAHTCSIGATSVPAAAAPLTLPSVASCNGTGTITVPANTSSTTNAVYTVTLTATGVAGTPAATASITITVPAAASAPQGSWVGTFGSSGYDLAAWNGGSDVASMPGVSVNLLQGARYVWASGTSDVRALENAAGTSRTAATYYDSSQIRVQLSFSTAYSGNLELYALDWDSGGRRETITVGGQTANLTTDFSQGAWVTVPITAAANTTITITVTPTAGANAVLSGIFLN